MTSSEKFVPNERLRRARSLKGWSQSDLAEQVGTSFEIVSRWERGVTLPSAYYRERLCAALGQSAGELGLLPSRTDAFPLPPSPLILLASSHKDAEKPIVSHLKAALQERGITVWSSRQLGRQGNGNARIALREAVQAAQVVLVIISPEAGASRHIREAMELASEHQRPVCGAWIEGEHWQEYLPKGSGTLAALIDARTSDGPVLIGEIATTLERVGLTSPVKDQPAFVDTDGHPRVSELATLSQEPQAVGATSDRFLEPLSAPTQLPADVPLLPPPPRKRQWSSPSRSSALLLIVLVVLAISGTILGSMSLLVHFGVIGTHSAATTSVVRGGTWIDDSHDPDSLIPNAGDESGFVQDNALYLPLFYGDAQGVVHPGAASDIPTVQNSDISADATTWTFHLRPHLVWSDGQPYDARDVEYTWRLWLNPRFGANFPNGATGFKLIRSADVSADHLSITFHLKQAYAGFLQYWVDGYFAPLPAHHFSRMAPEQIFKSSDNLNPTVVSGPFLLAESVPGDHYTLVRNPRYYRAREGLPYLGKVVFRSTDQDTVLQDLQAGTITSAWFLDVSQVPTYRRLSNYTLVTSPTSAVFEALWFNFHNTILASHAEVRQAMAMAIDHQALIQVAGQGFLATTLCTDHPSALHPGYELYPNCPVFDAALANQLLSDHGWVKGADGVRTKGGQRLSFEFATRTAPFRIASEAVIERNFKAIGIQLDIHNYDPGTFFGSLLPGGKASPPTGAVAGRYDIVEWRWVYGYDPDDSSLLACDQMPPNGVNWEFYCNPALDALYREELATADAGERQQIFHQIHQIYLKDLPFITLYSPTDLSIVRKGTHNYLPSPFAADTVNIWQWWCDHGKC